MATIHDVEDAYLEGKARWEEAIEEIGREFFLPYALDMLQMVYLELTPQEKDLLATMYPETAELIKAYKIEGGQENATPIY